MESLRLVVCGRLLAVIKERGILVIDAVIAERGNRVIGERRYRVEATQDGPALRSDCGAQSEAGGHR
ncbi:MULTISPECIES: hypothetical protein [unclassified Myxococcus]|uniref:hypothetical protein n=1 Tax=Myxococcus TaxID=32 RepID=UPI001E5E089F|nr:MULTISPECIES: hypothetical protein [unclassified Myxococcus]